MGFLSRLIAYLVAPIPIKKQTTDPRAVINCIKVAKEGGSIAIAPEGNRTFSGKTEYIKPSITQLAKHLGLPIAFYRFEGGYGIHPRWSDKVRRGTMTGRVSKVIYPDEYKAMSDGELYETICRELYNDETLIEGEYRSKALAEYLERAVYVCPECGISEFYSEGDTVECLRCKRKVKYLKTKTLSGVGFDFPFRNVKEWYKYQSDFINSLDLDALTDEPICSDDASFSKVILYSKKECIYENARVTLYKNRITVASGTDVLEYPFDKLSAVTVLGKNKVDLYLGTEVYQISDNPRLCALKYVNIYHRYINIRNGEKNAEFLGL
jgi:1-acyl-sn-glycerol-3-phosphate acyltransferase